MVKAVGYIRVSTEMQANEGVSLDAQSAKIAGYCELNDLELVEIIADAGKSAKTTDRDGLQRALAMLASGEAQALVVYKLDRLSRKVKDTLDLIEQIEQSKASLHSIVEKLDTSSALGRFFVNMTASLAQLERDQVSERTQMAMQHKKEQGQHCGAAPFGFAMVDKELVRIEAESSVIGFIQSLRDEGLTLRQIADRLNAENIATQRGGKWYATTVKNVLDKVA